MTKPQSTRTHHPESSPSTGGTGTVGVTRALGVVADDAKPSGLITLSGTEMWERFSFYGLQVLLAYYLYFSLSDGGLGLPQAVALGIAGSYGGLVYIAQIVGAWIADRVLAAKHVVFIGAAAIMIGHLLLAFVPGLIGLVCGLALIVVGTGGLKVNTTMMVGALYPEGGAKRDAGYSIYYMGITIGAFFGPLLTGVLHQNWGFHVAFGAAAAGMAVGLVQYAVGMRKLPAGTAVVPNPLPARSRKAWAGIALLAIAVIAVAVAVGIIRAENISDVVALVVVGAAIAYFAVLLSSREVSRAERYDVIRFVPIFLMSLVFWTLLFQLFTAFAVFADTKIDLNLGSVSVSPTLIVTLESLVVAAFTALLALLWSRSRAARISPVTKVVSGVVFMALGAAAIVPFSIAIGQSMPLLVAIAVMLLFAMGEALFAPAALSITAGMSPRSANAQMTALYFLTMAGGSTLAGRISQFYETGSEALYFGTVAVISLAAILILALIWRAVDRTLQRRA